MRARIARSRLAGSLLVLALIAAAGRVGAQEVLELEAIYIIGNPELPKTIHLVPWKRPLPGELAGQPDGSLLREDLSPVDPPVFRRELEYYQAGFAID